MGNEFASPKDYSENFLFLSKKFLNATSYKEMERYSRLLMRNVFIKHGKSQDMSPALENLILFELYFDYDYRPKQKLHFWHLTNVFLLGLYLFHKVEVIKSSITNYLKNTCPSVRLAIRYSKNDLLNKDWQYSADSPFGEFLYRWRLASLSHDIGTPFSQVGKERGKIREMLHEFSSISTIFLEDIYSVLNYRSKFLDCTLKKESDNELVYYPAEYIENSKTIFKHLDECFNSISLEKYVENQKKKSYNQEIYYDHGIFGALLFIIIVNNNFRLYDEQRIYQFDKGIWHPYLFRKSLMHSAKAIAMHNLDQDEESLALSLNNSTNEEFQIFDFEKDPLSWLLKISDTLQVWDKPTTEIINKSEEPEATLFGIDIEGNNKIILRNLPHGDKHIEKIMKYTKSPIKFSLE